ncbi:MAG TPA: M28 family peptidase [Gemmatimonadaceae bacterium]|nr:M28 family peptidase [Gemmatimonadaceae bacterium]
MNRLPLAFRLCAALVISGAPNARAQSFPVNDSVLKKIWTEGTDRSQVYPLAQALADSIGPRLFGSPAIRSGSDWLISRYRMWGIPARLEQHGTWRAWKRGISHLDLLAPRVRSLEATMLAWSPGTKGRVQAPTIILGDRADSIAFQRWLPAVKGKVVLMSGALASCRPDSDIAHYALPATLDSMRKARLDQESQWTARIIRTGYSTRNLPEVLERAGAVGILTSTWSGGWGVDRIFLARAEKIPAFDVSCEDYGLLYRLTENSQQPVVRLEAESQSLGVVPVFNTLAEIRGTEKPNEYVMLSAHFDSWDGASAATDNGTGTVTMLEAMRILSKVYPRPKRTILVGHWSGEELGLVGSRAFAADHPEIVQNLYALFNQDNGTGRIENLSAGGLLEAGTHLARWFSLMPAQLTRGINLSIPGSPAAGGSDNASFACYGAPAFNLGSLDWNYGTYTWHTNRDTFDKIIFDDLRNNAILVATLVYLASEDPDPMISRQARANLFDQRTGANAAWPACTRPPRSWEESTR